jgi:antirestriction protein
MLKVEVKIFVGRVSAPAIGGWITLPMSQEELAKAIKTLNVGEEYMISDYQTDLPIEINEYQSPFEINEFLHMLQEREKQGNLKLFLTAYWYRDGNLEDTLSLLKKGNFKYYENVHDTESLGEAVVCSGELGFIRKEIKPYLDFEKIGHDWECNGCRINDTLKTAIMETNPNL